MIKTVVKRALAICLQSDFFYSAVEQAAKKSASESQRSDTVVTRMIDAPASTVPLARFIKQEVEKSASDKDKMEERFNKLDEAVDGKKNKIEDGISTKRADSVQSPS